jgi:hypothetical protein
MTVDAIKSTNDLDKPWLATLLLDAIGFQSRVRGRVEDYLEGHDIPSLSLRELMDLFLPAAPGPPIDELAQFGMNIPMLRQPQFGSYLHDSALLTMTEATMSQEFKTEWAIRICRMVLYELRKRPANKRLQRTANKRRGR